MPDPHLWRETVPHHQATPTQRRLAREHAERMQRWAKPAPQPKTVAIEPRAYPESVDTDWITTWLDGWSGKIPFMVSYRHVQRIVAERCNLTREILVSAQRTQHVAMARQIAMALCLELVPNASLPKVGRWFGNRDHTTVLHARDKIKERCADPDFAAYVDAIRQAIKRTEHTIG